MAKKTRRVKQQSQQRAIQQALNNTRGGGSNSPIVAAAPAMGTRSFAAKVELDPAEEYKYVRSDLKRIGLLAVSFTAILVALSFFIK